MRAASVFQPVRPRTTIVTRFGCRVAELIEPPDVSIRTTADNDRDMPRSRRKVSVSSGFQSARPRTTIATTDGKGFLVLEELFQSARPRTAIATCKRSPTSFARRGFNPRDRGQRDRGQRSRPGDGPVDREQILSFQPARPQSAIAIRRCRRCDPNVRRVSTHATAASDRDLRILATLKINGAPFQPTRPRLAIAIPLPRAALPSRECFNPRDRG